MPDLNFDKVNTHSFRFAPMSGGQIANSTAEMKKEHEHGNEAFKEIGTTMFFDLLGTLAGLPGLSHALEAGKALGEAGNKMGPGQVDVINLNPKHQLAPHLAFRGTQSAEHEVPGYKSKENKGNHQEGMKLRKK